MKLSTLCGVFFNFLFLVNRTSRLLAPGLRNSSWALAVTSSTAWRTSRTSGSGRCGSSAATSTTVTPYSTSSFRDDSCMCLIAPTRLTTTQTFMYSYEAVHTRPQNRRKIMKTESCASCKIHAAKFCFSVETSHACVNGLFVFFVERGLNSLALCQPLFGKPRSF